MSNPQLPAPQGEGSANVPAKMPDVPYFVTPEDMVKVWSSFPEGNAGTVIAAMQGGSAAPFSEHIGKSFDVEHVIAHRVELVDEETGEVIEADRVILVAPDGAMVAGVSVGLKRGVQLLMSFFGLPPWKPALRVELRQVNTRKGRRTYTLVPIDNPEDRKTRATAKATK